MATDGLNWTAKQTVDRGAIGKLDLLSQLRTDILNGVFEPETRLKFADLTKRYGVGVGTLREALSQLSSERIVRGETGKGFRVAPVSREELTEITDHFINFEKRAVREAIEHGTDDWEANIVAAHHRLSRIESLPWEQRIERYSEWLDRHRQFHQSIVAAGRGRWLFRLRSIMFDQLDRYRFVTKRASQGLGRREANEHREIMMATLDRDADMASKLIEQHIRASSERAAKLL